MELKEHFTRESTDAFSLWIQLSSDDTYYKLTMPYWNSFSTPNTLSMTWWHSTKYGTSDSRKRWSSSLGAGSCCHCPTCQGSVVPVRATLGNQRVSKYSIYCMSLSYHGISEKKKSFRQTILNPGPLVSMGKKIVRRWCRDSRCENTSETQWDSIVFPLEWLTLITLTRASIGED